MPGGEPRVAMLETIREFAADRLDQRPDVGARARRAHATYFADLARRLRGGPDRAPSARPRSRRWPPTSRTCGSPGRYWVAAGDLEQLDKLADSLLILDDAHGWYLDTVGLTTDMLAVLGAGSSSPDRVGQEIALRTSLARALMATKGFTPEVEDAFASAVELFERGADVRQQYSVLRGLASLYQFRAQLDQAARLGREILALGEREHDPRMLIDGHLVVGSTMVFIDDLQGGLDHLDQAISLFAAGPTQARTARVGNDPRVACYTTSAFTLWLLGYPDRAVERANAALALAVELEHPFTSAYARFHSGLLHLWRREPDDRARPGGRAARDRRRARLPDLDRGRKLPPGSRAGRTRPLRGGPGQHPQRDGPLPGAPVAAGVLADAALPRRRRQPPRRTAGRRPPPARCGHRDHEPRRGHDRAARAPSPEGRPARGAWRPTRRAAARAPSTGTGSPSTAPASWMPG